MLKLLATNAVERTVTLPTHPSVILDVLVPPSEVRPARSVEEAEERALDSVMDGDAEGEEVEVDEP